MADLQFWEDVGRGTMDAVNRGVVGTVAGGGVDMANAVLNLGKAAVGYAGRETGLLRPDQMPEVNENPVGGSEWWGKQMQDAGAVSERRNPLAEGIAGAVLPVALPLAASAAAPKVMRAMEQGAKNLKSAPEITGKGAKQRGMMLGRLSKGADLNALDLAENLESQGMKPEKIARDTGWMRGVDGSWQYEISDHEAKLLLPNDIIGHLEGESGPLASIFEHPELYKEMPELANMKVRFKTDPGFTGSYSSHDNSISVNPEHYRQRDPNTMLHEIQHAVQEAEGFDPGANPNTIKNAWHDEFHLSQADFDMSGLTAWTRELMDKHGVSAPEAVDMLRGMDKGLPLKRGIKLYDAHPEVKEVLHETVGGDLKDIKAMFDRARDLYSEANHNYNNPMDAYMSNIGEAQSCQTELRAKMTPAERAAKFPMSDVNMAMPRDEQKSQYYLYRGQYGSTPN